MCVGPWCWDNFRGLLESRGYECIAPALPFHGLSPAAVPDARLGTSSLLDYARALEDEIKALDAKPVLVGHSMGGLLAQILGSRGLARALVLLAPAWPAGVLAVKWSAIRSFRSVLMTPRFWRKAVRPTFADAQYAMMELLPAGERKEIYDRLVYESGRAIAEIGFWFLDPHNASAVDRSRITCPVLVVAGAHDRLTPASIVRRIAERYRAVSTYTEFPDHGHWVLGEPGWEQIADHVLAWLALHVGDERRQ
jgi:pimeloyl-ACP methyl ester carboxylesterase